MLVIGLTGGIATGKSSASTLLKSHGLPIIDADILAREVVAPGTPGLARIKEHFGSGVLLEDGSGGLDRKKLGSIVFNDEAKRKVLNGIVHPAVRKAMVWSVVKFWLRGEAACVVDVPLLIEGGLWKWVGKVVVVYCSEDLQLKRLMKRDSSTQAEAQSRLSAQLPISRKGLYADTVIDNSGTPADLETDVRRVVEGLKKDQGLGIWWRACWLIPPVGLWAAGWCLLWRAVWRGRKERAEKRRKRIGKR